MDNLDSIFGEAPAVKADVVPVPFVPGIVQGMPEEKYHAVDAIGSSPLKRFHDRPSSILEPFKATEAMNLGSAQDCYTLYGPEEFEKRFIIMPDFGDIRTKTARDDRAAFISDYAEFTVLPPNVTTDKIPTFKAIQDVDNFLYKEHPMTRIIMRKGEQQVSMFWCDEDTGLPCKGRLDHYPDPAYKTIFDLKKCDRIDNFHNQMVNLRYFLQGGSYTVGARQNGMDVVGFAFIAFSFGTPPKARIVAMDDDYMEKSMRLAKITVSLINECRQANNFPDYSIPISTVSMAKMLGIESSTARQLAPQEFIEVAQTPYFLREV